MKGSMVHAHVGYVIPGKSKHVFNLMFLDERQIDALNDNASQLGIGANAFFSIILN
jgi:hypothetical protein